MEGSRRWPERLAICTLRSLRRRSLLKRAIRNVLSSDAARETYAQIVDGLPLARVADDSYGRPECVLHPLHEEHKELCAGVADEADRLLTEIDIDELLMPADALRAFGSTTARSPRFPALLIELVARAVHEVAAQIYKKDTNRHKDDALGRFRPPEAQARGYPKTFPETVFCHEWYDHYDQYPEGVADCVGYWAEGRILGGVIVFDRRDPAKVKDASPNAIYTHPYRWRITYRICRLLDSQVSELVEFLLSEPEESGTRCPLPVLPTQENRDRIDPEADIHTTGIYRDPWERRLRPLREGDRRTGCIVNTFDFLTDKGWSAAQRRRFSRLAPIGAGIPVSPELAAAQEGD
ncbi:hypothetical protein VTJ49DRAFT_3427 [Mycothermus thermophilus]|uniref:Uncharacterized protein n=1 Tax=Humicola insolens TaxID=85995 RepID=A0ABR3V7K0_HUMIN